VSPPALSCEAVADWIVQGNPRYYDSDAAVATSREQWCGTPRYRDQMAVGDPFRGFEGCNVPVPPDIAAARAAPRLEPLPRDNR
jgi:hypothetical protein